VKTPGCRRGLAPSAGRPAGPRRRVLLEAAVMGSLAARLRSVDAYRKISADVTEGTPYGGIISLMW